MRSLTSAKKNAARYARQQAAAPSKTRLSFFRNHPPTLAEQKEEWLQHRLDATQAVLNDKQAQLQAALTLLDHGRHDVAGGVADRIAAGNKRARKNPGGRRSREDFAKWANCKKRLRWSDQQLLNEWNGSRKNPNDKLPSVRAVYDALRRHSSSELRAARKRARKLSNT
jgi:hypothetical protein